MLFQVVPQGGGDKQKGVRKCSFDPISGPFLKTDSYDGSQRYVASSLKTDGTRQASLTVLAVLTVQGKNTGSTKETIDTNTDGLNNFHGSPPCALRIPLGK